MSKLKEALVIAHSQQLDTETILLETVCSLWGGGCGEGCGGVGRGGVVGVSDCVIVLSDRKRSFKNLRETLKKRYCPIVLSDFLFIH